MAKSFSVTREWEILEEMDKNESVREALMKQYGNTSPLNYLFSLNFNPNVVLDLPPGMPPYQRDEATNSDFQGALVHNIQKLKYCFPNNNLKKIKKEMIFVEMLESMPPKSADIVCACKDKELAELFPNITAELVKKYWPVLVGV